MEQTYENRGKIAFIADQVELATAAFVNNDFATLEGILQETAKFIGLFLLEANQKRQ
jgi:hypothetical protein